MSALESEETIIHLTASQLWNLVRAAIQDGFEYSAEGYNEEYMNDKFRDSFESDLDKWTELFIETKSQSGDIPL